MKQYLKLSIDDLCLECVLMQAWKKTSTYLRTHSWYADTLGLDYESLRLPQFIQEIQERLREPESWKSKPIELVPAPKNQQWSYQNGKWEPRGKKIEHKLRPLAHVDLQDQVVATAIMLCLADRLETALGDPRLTVNKAENRQKVLAYGNRLFCDQDNDELHHRWGSTKLYRQYYQDYQTFLERPKIVVKQLMVEMAQNQDEYDIAIVQSDLSKFYDRVRPKLLREKLDRFCRTSEEEAFFRLTGRVFDWRWSDQRRADSFAKGNDIVDFGLVALPQGLVTAGFFANIVLYDLNIFLRNSLRQVLPNSELVLEDACYYVDDLRLVLRIPKGESEASVKSFVIDWLQGLLDRHAYGLKIASEKTEVTVENREKRFLVRQSSEATRIQNQVSGTFDMLHGTELIAAIEGFFHTQQRYSVETKLNIEKDAGLLVGVPDMRDDTAARFAAGKFRRTFRSLRPLLISEQTRAPELSEDDSSGIEDDEDALPRQLILTKEQLDERAKFFAALLIEEWINNPGNVRLLRIALDLYPDGEFLKPVLKLLRQGWEPSSVTKAEREVRLYCLAELFRAGATETGFVQDDECLPNNLSTEKYHEVLINEAHELFGAYIAAHAKASRFPWYLMQQVFLYLSARNAMPENMIMHKAVGGKLLSQHWGLAKFISGVLPTTLEQRSIFLVIAKTGYGISGFDFLGHKARLSDKFLSEVDRISPPAARDLWEHFRDNASEQVAHTAQRLGLEHRVDQANKVTIAEASRRPKNPFYEEENLLELAYWLLLNSEAFKQTITPWQVRCAISRHHGYEFGKIIGKSFDFIMEDDNAAHLFKPPDWCESHDERCKLQVGLLLRYALRGSTDFYSNYSSKKQSHGLRYKRPISHWEQQKYSGFQGRNAFGPAWLPISSFTEDILFELLRWPGSGIMNPQKSVAELMDLISKRLEELHDRRGKITSAPFLEQKAPWPGSEPKSPWDRILRVGIVQSIIPSAEDYEQHANDPELLKDLSFRTRQRRHLAAIMEGVSQMLLVRDTHCQQTRSDGRTIDLLIFPELAIHPDDVDTLVLPFVRKHKCIVLFGQVYHHKDSQPSSSLINSCLWMVPEWRKAEGLQIRRIEQGKQNLTEPEKELEPKPTGFRPAQWLIEYQWHSDKENHHPLILSASICYDATDLALAADLRSRSDLYIICALNHDVGTFDRMSESLHYHMFQGVILVNNGQYGGSNFFMPFEQTFHRQVFHLHGQPQAAIAFAEISPQKLLDRPNPVDPANSLPEGKWKTPPAGWIARNNTKTLR